MDFPPSNSICQSGVPNNLGASGPRGITCTKRVAQWDENSGASRDIGNRSQRVQHEKICSIIMSHYMFYLSCLSFLDIFPLVGDRSPEQRGRVWYISDVICRKSKPWTLEHPAWSSTIRITTIKNRLHTAMSVFWEEKKYAQFLIPKNIATNIRLMPTSF